MSTKKQKALSSDCNVAKEYLPTCILTSEIRNIDHRKILNIIECIRDSFPNAVKVYKGGSCIQFALILLNIFDKGHVYYDQDHAIFNLHDKYYDITGEVKKGRHVRIETVGLKMLNDLLKLTYKD